MPGPVITAADLPRLADLIVGEAPSVTAFGIESDQPRGVKASLLVWGLHVPTRRWAAGITWVFDKFRGAPVQALLSMWLPAEQVERRHGGTYAAVPRLVLTGPAGGWPSLPPIHPRLAARWYELHLHVRADPTGEYYEHRDAMRAFRR